MTGTRRKGRRQFSNLKEQASYDRELAILELTEAVVAAMERQGLTRAAVAEKLEKSKPYITQLLNGPNFTFGTAAELACAVGLRFTVRCEDDDLPVFQHVPDVVVSRMEVAAAGGAVVFGTYLRSVSTTAACPDAEHGVVEVAA